MRLLVLMLGALLLTACYEYTDVTMHQAGVYKGSEDNHALSAEERAEILKQRFNSVQTDR
ncbi:MAG TPA: hypothetical protein DCE77_13295 [Methylophaga sp.]|jgi:major membrane immunogen (membrane-anchored lipoprotein)|uniref:hypothetical protein n=1 Tax=unclassified Methylophaga TaxID=2629249 RepID=UPI000C94AD54|nr:MULTISPECIES: hypothetical protein [unclassified Methylophaga]MAP26440.1 hypothetical protein [Methylophaga sp.]HAD32545.1 hypothetical protein [Methylophaga sp.]HBX58894.1 hypothetical protein [Methylophaga sp.]HCN99023.1 hypothetical protein [Methylophaga sp.]|tara:strand:+ start:6443 stop:6622 length:180 start_codon:yes stop_codon:yes gene_type:complete